MAVPGSATAWDCTRAGDDAATGGSVIGIDANEVVDPQTGAIAHHVADPSILSETGTQTVRLRFQVRPWASVEDKTLHDGRTWAQTYRTIVDGLRGAGLCIYASISNEILPEHPGDSLRDPPPEDESDHEWMARYAAAYGQVVEEFHADVDLFESFAEPDDWHGSQRNWIHPGWYAVMLQRIYDTVHIQPEMRDVHLVSGPLQGLAVNNNAAALYLRAVYDQGKRRFGWGMNHTPFPFDGVGYHLFIAEEHQADRTPLEEESLYRDAYRRYIVGVRQVIQEEEGRAKPIYISAFGWRTNRNSEEFQAERLRQAAASIHADPSVSLGVWCRLQDTGVADGDQYYGLYRPGALAPENRKPSFYAFQEVCRQPLPSLESSRFDNRTLVKAITLAARDAGQSRYQIFEQANLWGLFLDRAVSYRGPAVDALPGVSESMRCAIRACLVVLLAGSEQIRGEIRSGPLNLRSGPGAETDVLDQLPAHTPVVILQDNGDWLRVEAQGKEGFVYREFVALPDEQLQEGYLYSREDLCALALEPPPDRLINSATVQTPSERLLASIWNEYGRLLAVVADELNIDPSVAEAVFAVESGGKCFASDGRMIIRFENHLFHRHWGAANPERFEQHFQFDPDTPWQGHRWRSSVEESFEDQHQWQGSLDANQSAEWEVFNFAATLDPHAARLSISMGAPQILGSNHAVIGYETVEQMFDAFAGSAHAQLLGFFDFLKADPQRVRSLQKGDYRTFAQFYNGNGQADHYGRLIDDQAEAFDQVLARQDAVSFGAPADFEIDTDGISFLPPIWPQPDAPTPADETAGSGKDAAPDAESGGQEVSAAVSAVDSERLRQAWEDYMVEGLENTNRMFNRTLNAYMIPYYLTVGMYVVLFAVGVGLFVTAAWLAGSEGNEITSIVFAGLGTLTFLAIFIRYPLRALEENLQFITWMGLIYNTYWTRLLYLQDPENIQEELTDATQSAIADMERMIDKNAALAQKRPGSGAQN